MENTTNNIQNWLDEELEKYKVAETSFKQLPSLKLVPNVITEIDVDFSKPFDKWDDEVNQVTKAIIPVKVNGTEMAFWLNTRNPLYFQLIKAGREGISRFKILQTGTQKNTKYTIVS